jgi:hypothetical protein
MKGDCYQAAYHTAREQEPDDYEKVWLVHGFVTTPKAGRIAHAWVEIEGGKDWALDYSNGQSFVLERNEFYELLKAEVVVRYSPDEGAINFIRSRHYGPWHE